LESQGLSIPLPREVIKQAFAARLIENGHIWIEMLDTNKFKNWFLGNVKASAVERSEVTQY
jgi:hypothetical protein